MSTHKLKNGFSLLEVMMAITIFTVIAGFLYSLTDALTRMNSGAMGQQRFSTETINLLQRIEDEVSEAMVGQFYVAKLNGPNDTDGGTSTFEFRCLPRNIAHPLRFLGDNLGGSFENDFRQHNQTQQLFWITSEERFSKDWNRDGTRDSLYKYFTDQSIANPYRVQDEDMLNITWNTVTLTEKILYMTNAVAPTAPPYNFFRLQMWVRDEMNHGPANPVVLPAKHYNNVDGLANVDFPIDYDKGDFALRPRLANGLFDNARIPPALSPMIDDIEFFFWGNQNTSWDNNGNGIGNPITSWDSTIAENFGAGTPKHGVDELPRAMKVVITRTYNPDMYNLPWHLRNTDKDQQFSFEKVIIFRNRS